MFRTSTFLKRNPARRVIIQEQLKQRLQWKHLVPPDFDGIHFASVRLSTMGFTVKLSPYGFCLWDFQKCKVWIARPPFAKPLMQPTYSKLMQPNTQGYYSQKKVAWMCSMLKFLHSRKLAWQRKIAMFNRKYIFKWWIFHDHVSFRGNEFSCGFIQPPSTTPPVMKRS